MGLAHHTTPWPPPPPPQKSTCLFGLKTISCQSFGVVVGGVAQHTTPPPPPQNSNMILKLGKIFLSNFGVVVGVWHIIPPPTPQPQKSTCLFGLKTIFLPKFLGGGGWFHVPYPHPTTTPKLKFKLNICSIKHYVIRYAQIKYMNSLLTHKYVNVNYNHLWPIFSTTALLLVNVLSICVVLHIMYHIC